MKTKNKNRSHSIHASDRYDVHACKSKTSRALLLLTSIALLDSGGCAVKPPPTIDTTANTTLQVSPTEIKITASEFNYKPAQINAKIGESVRLTLDNKQGAIEHDVVIKELGIHLSAKAGQVSSKDLVFKQPGEYIFTGESLLLQKLVLGIPAQSSGKSLTRRFILLRKHRFVLFICPDPTRAFQLT